MSTATTTTYIEQSTYTPAVMSSLTLSPSTHVHSTDEVNTTLYVSMGVSCAMVVVLIATVIGICVITYLRKRRVKLVNISVTDATDNATSKNDEIKLSGNVAYSTTKSTSSKDENTYDYVPVTISPTDGNDIITSSPNEAYAVTDNVPVSSNQAYGIVTVHH